jgi:hypothetical protein
LFRILTQLSLFSQAPIAYGNQILDDFLFVLYEILAIVQMVAFGWFFGDLQNVILSTV